MAELERAESRSRGAEDRVTDEIVSLLRLVRRLEHENTALRRQLSITSPLAA